MRLMMAATLALPLTMGMAHSQELSIDIWVDNWFAVYADGALVLEDPVSITTERSFNAGSATFSVDLPTVIAIEAKDFKENEKVLNGASVYHVVGKGKTTGAISWFFKVRDRYESFIDKDKLIPYKFVRDVNEGGYTKNIVIEFDQINQKAHVNNIKHNTQKVIETRPNVQDMVSTFYYLRDNMDMSALKVGDEVKTDMFFDEENYGFKIKYLGEETVRTKFGKIKCLKFRPYVMAGRVFKEEESLTLWVSADKNKVPIRIKADLAVGSLRADLDAFKGLKHQFKIQF